MNILRRLFGASRTNERDSPSDFVTRAAAKPAADVRHLLAEAGDALIMQYDVIPDKLTVRLYRHAIDPAAAPVDAWTYLSVGLSRLGHPEIRMTFPWVERKEGCYLEPFRLLKGIHAAAEQGHIVGPFGQTRFAEGILGFHGIVYVEAAGFKPFAGVHTLPGTLHAVFLKEHETAEVGTVGCPLRQLARIGYHHRYYPCPPWSDPARPDLGPTAEGPPSLLAQMGWLPAGTCSVIGDGTTVTLQVPPSSVRQLCDRIATVPPEAAFALSLGLDRGAHGCYVWLPGQSGPMAITTVLSSPPGDTTTAPPDARLGGCFVAFAPGADSSGASQFEDGFVVLLTDVDWHRVRHALERGATLTVEPTTPDRLRFAIRPLQEVYVNPVDGREYHARWSTHLPVGGPRTGDLPPGTAVSWRLLTSDSDMAARISVADLAAFGKRAETTALGLLSESAGSGDLTIQFDCQPDGFEVRLAHRGRFSPAVLRMLQSQLESLDPIRPTDSVSFQLEVVIQEHRPAG